MSHVPRAPDLPVERDSLRRVADAAADAARPLVRNLRVASFWVAIVLPAIYLPLLAGGLSGREAILFAVLVAINAGAFVVGHEYDPDDGA